MNEQIVQAVGALCHLAERCYQTLCQRAADAAVGQLDDLVSISRTITQQPSIDVDFSELVDNYGCAAA